MSSESYHCVIRNEAIWNTVLQSKPLPSCNPPATDSPPPNPAQASFVPLQVFAASFHPSQQSVALSTGFSNAFQDLPSRQHTNGGKRSHGFDDDRAYKQARIDPQSKLELSENNLRQLDEDNLRQLDEDNLRQLEEDNFGQIHEDNLRELDSLSDMGLKRVQSTRSMSQVSEEKSSGPTIPPAAYRFNLLDNARTHLRWGPPPEEIQKYINSVIKAQYPKDTTPEMTELFKKRIKAKKTRISPIAQKLMYDFRDVFAGPVREDHSVEPIFTALKSMDPDDKLGLLRKAGIMLLPPHVPRFMLTLCQDWETSLKPSEADDYTWIRPRKRQQEDSISVTMPPPPASKEESSLVKTPRPDITVGPRHNLFVHTLVERARLMEQQGILRPGGWTKGYADRKLKSLQNRGMLISDPTQQGIIRFPGMVIEGKAYSTGKQVFEAQNQSIVSGACITNLQQQNFDRAKKSASDPHRGKPRVLASESQNQSLVSGACIANLQQQNPDLTDKAASDPHRDKPPILGFSMSTEGPYLELCANTTAWDPEDNDRDFDMYIIKSCNVCVFEEILDFLMLVEDVEMWMTGPYLDNMADLVILGDEAG